MNCTRIAGVQFIASQCRPFTKAVLSAGIKTLVNFLEPSWDRRSRDWKNVQSAGLCTPQKRTQAETLGKPRPLRNPSTPSGSITHCRKCSLTTGHTPALDTAYPLAWLLLYPCHCCGKKSSTMLKNAPFPNMPVGRDIVTGCDGKFLMSLMEALIQCKRKKP